MVAHTIRLGLLKHNGRSTAATARVLDLSADNHARNTAQVVDCQVLDATAHVPDGDLAAVDLDRATQVLELHHTALEVHEQAGTELVLGSSHFGLLEAREARGESQRAELLTHDVEHSGGAAGKAAG